MYTNLLIEKVPLDLYFHPIPGAFGGGPLRVAPDLLPPGKVRLARVWIDGRDYTDFDPNALLVRLPQSRERLRVKVRLEPV